MVRWKIRKSFRFWIEISGVKMPWAIPTYSATRDISEKKKIN